MFSKLLQILLSICLISSFLAPIPQARAQGPLNLPKPGTMVYLSESFQPVLMKGLVIHPNDPFLFDFMIDAGQAGLKHETLKQEGEKLIKYFLASLAIPEKDLWVNLSPYEKDRTIPETLSQTDMGRDLLAQDYILKQVTATLIYPEKNLGKEFWDRVYLKVRQAYGTTEIPVNTFNKVWIIADRAEVYEKNNSVFVVDQHLKVMLEEDYLAFRKAGSQPKVSDSNITHQIVRQIILPALEKEVNHGKNFAPLRQIYNSLILASWYKNNLKEFLFNQVYANQQKIKGIDLEDKTIKDQIYQQYLKAYKKGVFNYIKEDSSGIGSGASQARKYFSGGLQPGAAANPKIIRDTRKLDAAMSAVKGMFDFRVHVGLGSISSTKNRTKGVLPDEDKKIENFSHRVIRWKATPTKDERFNVQITEVFDFDAGPSEKAVMLKNMAIKTDFIILSEETIRLAQDGDVQVTLTPDMGIIPRNYVGQTMKILQRTMDLFNSSEGGVIPASLTSGQTISAGAAALLKVRVYDEKKGRYLYCLKVKTDNNRFEIFPMVGDYQFLPGGVSHYREILPLLQPIDSTNNMLQVRMPLGDWISFLNIFTRGFGREKYPLRQLIEILNTPTGIIPVLPERWKNPGYGINRSDSVNDLDLALTADIAPGGIDLNVQNMQMKITKENQGNFEAKLNPAIAEQIKANGFDFIKFNIQSIVLSTNFLSLLNPQ